MFSQVLVRYSLTSRRSLIPFCVCVAPTVKTKEVRNAERNSVKLLARAFKLKV